MAILVVKLLSGFYDIRENTNNFYLEFFSLDRTLGFMCRITLEIVTRNVEVGPAL